MSSLRLIGRTIRTFNSININFAFVLAALENALEIVISVGICDALHMSVNRHIIILEIIIWVSVYSSTGVDAKVSIWG